MLWLGSLAAFAFVGACLPSLGSRDVSLRERIPWAGASLVMLLAQYLTFGFWDTAQRESFIHVHVERIEDGARQAAILDAIGEQDEKALIVVRNPSEVVG